MSDWEEQPSSDDLLRQAHEQLSGDPEASPEYADEERAEPEPPEPAREAAASEPPADPFADPSAAPTQASWPPEPGPPQDSQPSHQQRSWDAPPSREPAEPGAGPVREARSWDAGPPGGGGDDLWASPGTPPQDPQPAPPFPVPAPGGQKHGSLGPLFSALVSVVVVVGLTLWRVGVFDRSVSEQFLADARESSQEMGISDAGWDCIESNLRANGYVEPLDDLDDADIAYLESLEYDSALTDAPPAVQAFVEAYFRYAFDPVEGCLSPQEIAALGDGAVDPDAPMDYGSHPVLDMLYDGCQAGSLADCDMLWFESPVASEYEDLAETCAGRNSPLDFDFDLCQLHHGDLSEMNSVQSQCQGGFFSACDLLYIMSDIGSSQEQVGATCGGRRSASATLPCSVEFGYGSRS